MKNSSCLNQESNMYNTIYYNKGWTFPLEGVLLWTHILPRSDGLKLKTYFLFTDINWWTGVVWITWGLLWRFYQLFGLSFWRHPFTAEDPLVSKWCNATFLQICSDEETNSSTSWMAWRWVNVQKIFIFGLNCSFKDCNIQMMDSADQQIHIVTCRASLIPLPMTSVCTPFLRTSSRSAGWTPG